MLLFYTAKVFLHLGFRTSHLKIFMNLRQGVFSQTSQLSVLQKNIIIILSKRNNNNDATKHGLEKERTRLDAATT